VKQTPAFGGTRTFATREASRGTPGDEATAELRPFTAQTAGSDRVGLGLMILEVFSSLNDSVIRWGARCWMR